MSQQPMTSEKKFIERYPEIVEAVHAAIRAHGDDPADYGFAVAGFVDGTLDGAYQSRSYLAARAAGEERVYPYTWFSLSAQPVSFGPLTDIEVSAITEHGPARFVPVDQVAADHPDLIDAVHAGIRAHGADPSDYTFTVSSIYGTELSGNFSPRTIIEAQKAGEYEDLPAYTWFAFTANMTDSEALADIEVTPVLEDNGPWDDEDETDTE